MQGGLEGSHHGSPIKRRRHGRIEDIKGLCPDERRVVPHNARRNYVKVCGARKGLKKAKGNAQ